MSFTGECVEWLHITHFVFFNVFSGHNYKMITFLQIYNNKNWFGFSHNDLELKLHIYGASLYIYMIFYFCFMTMQQNLAYYVQLPDVRDYNISLLNIKVMCPLLQHDDWSSLVMDLQSTTFTWQGSSLLPALLHSRACWIHHTTYSLLTPYKICIKCLNQIS